MLKQTDPKKILKYNCDSSVGGGQDAFTARKNVKKKEKLILWIDSWSFGVPLSVCELFVVANLNSTHPSPRRAPPKRNK